MLKPEYFNDKADRMIELYRQLEDYIFKDIAYRLLKSQSVSGTADRLIWKLEQMGESRAEIMNKLSKRTGLSKRELKELLQDAVITSWNDDLSTFNQIGINIVNPLENQAVMSVMNAEYQKCQGELDNLTRTTMNQAQVDLTRMLDEAEMRVASGVQSYSSAVCEILDNYAKKGMVVEYPTGTHRSLEAAVRCCVVTSMNQTSAQITNQYILEGGIEYVLVSAHLGARIQQPGQPYLAGHENWQGKVYRIRGSEPGYPNLLEMTGYDIGENGAGKVVNPLGLHGYNCRHSHQPWDKALKNPYVDENGKSTIDTEESRKLYQNQQKQRAMERSIRATKRRLLMKQQEIDLVAETDVKEILQNDYDKLAYKLREQNKAYNEFCTENDLQKQSDRLKVAGYKREQAAKANGRARAFENYNNSLEKSVPERNPLAKLFNTYSTAEFKKMAIEINKKLDEICLNKSKWSGNIHVKRIKAIGQKEWNCDITLAPNADYATVMHELIHARSISYYDDTVYARFRGIEEGSVELLTEQICKKNKVPFVSTYEEEVKHLLRVNRRAKIFVDDFEFAKELINVDITKRLEWLISKAYTQYNLGIINKKELEAVYDSVSKLMEDD